MKVLYAGSLADDAPPLAIDREVTAIQRRATTALPTTVEFTVLSEITVEDLPLELHRLRPDIVHLSAHGARDSLSLRRSDGKSVKITPKILSAFLSPAHPPRLVYLNACDSHEFARALIGSVPIAIGISAPITNRAARSGAVCFYDRLLSGCSVSEAFAAQDAIVRAIDPGTRSRLYTRHDVDPDATVLHQVPHLVAEFGSSRGRSTNFFVRFGLIGCPASTTQVVFFTDDQTFIDEDEEDEDLEGDLCDVVRGPPVRGELWLDDDYSWEVDGDFRLVAVGVTADGETFATSSMMGDAIEARYGASIPLWVARTVRALRSQDGAELAHTKATMARPQKAPKKKPARRKVPRRD